MSSPVRLAIASSLVVIGCIRQAPRPVAPREADACARQSVYEANKLAYHDRLLDLKKWSRADGEYPIDELHEVLDAYPRSRDLEARIKMRSNVIGTLVALGAFTAGFTLGYNVIAPPVNHWSTNKQLEAYGLGGGLVILGVLAAFVWDNPTEQLAATYNGELHEDLSPGACPTGSSMTARTR